jgi:hypothetical protein
MTKTMKRLLLISFLYIALFYGNAFAIEPRVGDLTYNIGDKINNQEYVKANK